MLVKVYGLTAMNLSLPGKTLLMLLRHFGRWVNAMTFIAFWIFSTESVGK